MVDFSSLLGKRSDEITRPKPLPIGTYRWVITSHEFGESAQKKTPYVRFKAKPTMAESDVDADLLAQHENWQSKEMKVDFYITDDALFRLDEFLEKAGVEDGNRTLAERIPETTNCEFRAVVEHQVDPKDSENVFANIGKILASE